MPTPPPEEMKEPASAAERIARISTLTFVRKLCDKLGCIAYNTRSHMPAGLDYTEFSDSLARVVKFCAARPDWTLKVLGDLLDEYQYGVTYPERRGQ